MLSSTILPLANLDAPSESVTRVGSTISSNDADGLTLAYVPPTHVLEDLNDGFLTGPKSGNRLDIARQYLAAHASELGLQQTDVTGATVTDQYTDPASGVTHIYLRQTYNGLPVVGAEMSIHLARDGTIISATSSFIGGLTSKGAPLPSATTPQLSASAALPFAGRALGLAKQIPTVVAEAQGGITLTASKLSLDLIPADTKYFATAEGVQLGWNFVLRPPDHNGDWYDIAVNAGDGSLLFSNNWTDHLAQYDVFPVPTEAPNDGSRQIVVDPSDPTASPFGWQDTNGAAGAEFTTTVGNNVSAQDDTDANNSGGFRPDGGASLNFDFPLDLTQPPSGYQGAAITNLFYWNNILHDVHYHYGFTEAAGNFQTNNYGRGGTSGDAVQADAQDGAALATPNVNNANFSTPPDGFAGRMQMYVWNATSPNRDGDLDATIMAHEFGHGVSNRLTGGPANANALNATQSGGMGEGWSDFWSLMFTQKPTDNVLTDGYGVATYSRGQANTGPGLRRFRYSYNMSINPLTIDAYGTSGSANGVNRSTEVHNTGELWCCALWDMAVLLEQKYGFDPNLYTGYTSAPGPGHAGNKLAWQLVLDAMKLQPANPSFAQARDAILQADKVLTGGQNQKEIWQAFARRGMGIGFSDGGSSGATSVTPSFVALPDDPIVLSSTPLSGKTFVEPISSMTFQFDEPIDPSSFSIADDVTFTGPGAANLAGSITDFSFSQQNLLLTINFTPVSTNGAYSLKIGPNILSADNGHPMDQNSNGTSGEAADAYTVNFTFASRLSDTGFGYQAAPWAFQDTALAPGGAGVSSILTNDDDASVVIPMGSNSFRFFNNTYSASSSAGSVNACDNGFVSFATASSASVAFTNTDLGSPIAARFAPLWDDWYTQVSSSDQVLYRFDDLNSDGTSDRLVVQWNDVHSTAGGSGVTFQAILQLNTGTTPGVMIANYININSDNVDVSNGAGSTVGIKDTGTPPPNKLLVSQDDGTFPWLGNSKAIRIATDWVAPTVTNSQFNLGGTSQTLTYQFSENVAASLSKSDLTLTNTTTNQTIPLANVALSYNTATNTATFTFPGYPTGLPDGNYTATLSGVTDAQWNPLAGSAAVNFFSLAGDANHDRNVDVTDLGILATNWQGSGKSFADGDFNYDGAVDVTDLGILATNWQKSLASAAARESATPTLASSPLARSMPLKPRHTVDSVVNQLDL